MFFFFWGGGAGAGTLKLLCREVKIGIPCIHFFGVGWGGVGGGGDGGGVVQLGSKDVAVVQLGSNLY